MNKHNGFSKLLKEPLLHFLLIGAGLFFYFSLVNADVETEAKEEIFIKKFKLDELSMTFEEENGTKISDSELKKLLKEAIREEVLYREAMAMGLHNDDKVIRHRLAEKMKYLFEDISLFDEAKEDEDFYDSLKKRYDIIMDDEIVKVLNQSTKE